VDPVDIPPHILPLIYVLRIEQLPESGQIRLCVNLTGTKLDAAFGRSPKGKYMESFLHGPHGAKVMAGYHRCARTQEPLWMRQVVSLHHGPPRFIEGVAVYLSPGYIYGGLVIGDYTATTEDQYPFQLVSLLTSA